MAIISTRRVYGSQLPCANSGDICPSLMFEVTHDAPIPDYTRGPSFTPLGGDPCREMLCPDCTQDKMRDQLQRAAWPRPGWANAAPTGEGRWNGRA